MSTSEQHSAVSFVSRVGTGRMPFKSLASDRRNHEQSRGDTFQKQIKGYVAETGTKLAITTAIIELGAWVGILTNGYIADAIGRRATTIVAVAVFIVGVIVRANTKAVSYILSGRVVIGLGVGSLTMIVPLYNAELVRQRGRALRVDDFATHKSTAWASVV